MFCQLPRASPTIIRFVARPAGRRDELARPIWYRFQSSSSKTNPHPPRLENKIAIVTGSSSGLGRAISLAYASHGTRLVICADLQPDSTFHEAETQPTHEIINEIYGPGKALFLRTDVTRSEDVKGAVDEAVRTAGRLDMWVLFPFSKIILDHKH